MQNRIILINILIFLFVTCRLCFTVYFYFCTFQVTLQLTQHLPDVMYNEMWGEAGDTITCDTGCLHHHRSGHTIICHLLQVLSIQVNNIHAFIVAVCDHVIFATD